MLQGWCANDSTKIGGCGTVGVVMIELRSVGVVMIVLRSVGVCTVWVW